VAGRRSPVTDIREILRRLQLGEPDRRVARDLGIGRNTVARYRVWAGRHGVLDGGPLPDTAALAHLLTPPPTERPAHERQHAAVEYLTEHSVLVSAARRPARRGRPPDWSAAAGISAAGFSSSVSGSKSRWRLPSAHGLFSVSTTRPSSSCRSRSCATACRAVRVGPHGEQLVLDAEVRRAPRHLLVSFRKSQATDCERRFPLVLPWSGPRVSWRRRCAATCGCSARSPARRPAP
jgi:hypothetical protein